MDEDDDARAIEEVRGLHEHASPIGNDLARDLAVLDHLRKRKTKQR